MYICCDVQEAYNNKAYDVGVNICCGVQEAYNNKPYNVGVNICCGVQEAYNNKPYDLGVCIYVVMCRRHTITKPMIWEHAYIVCSSHTMYVCCVCCGHTVITI